MGGLNDSHVFDVVKRIEQKMVRVAEAVEHLRPRFGFGGSTGTNVDINFDISALATELTLQAVAATAVDIETNTDPAGGLTIADWLEDIEADVDGIEGRLDDIIANTDETGSAIITEWLERIRDNLQFGIIPKSAAEFLEEIEDRVGDVDANTTHLGKGVAEYAEEIEDSILATNILLTAQAVILAIGNTSTDNIDDNTDGLESRLDTVIDLLEDLTFPDADVDNFTIPGANNDYRMQPDDSDSSCFVDTVEILNASAVFPVTFRFFLKNTLGDEVELTSLVTVIGILSSDSIEINRNIRRKCHLIIRASIAGGHLFKMAYLNNGSVTFDSPT